MTQERVNRSRASDAVMRASKFRVGIYSASVRMQPLSKQASGPRSPVSVLSSAALVRTGDVAGLGSSGQTSRPEGPTGGTRAWSRAAGGLDRAVFNLRPFPSVSLLKGLCGKSLPWNRMPSHSRGVSASGLAGLGRSAGGLSSPVLPGWHQYPVSLL